MSDINIEKMLRAAWMCPGLNGGKGLAVAFEAEPGAAKSARIKRIARRCGLPEVTLIAAIHEPADFLGPMVPSRVSVDEHTGARIRTGLHTEPDGTRWIACVEHAATRWAVQMTVSPQGGVVFLDEMRNTPPAVQSALLRVVLERVVGELELPPGVRFVAAQNSIEDAAGGQDIAVSLANRFGWAAWPMPTLDEDLDHILGGYREWTELDQAQQLDPEAEERRVMEAWPKAFAMECGTTAAFFRRRPELRHKKPPQGSTQLAWPSRRTHEMAARWRASARVHGLADAERVTGIGWFIGDGACSEFVALERTLDLPDPEEVLSGKVKFKHSDKRMDRTAAVLGSCSAYCGEVPDGEKRLAYGNAMWDLLDDVEKAGAGDLALAPLNRMFKAKIVGPKYKGSVPFLSRYASLLAAAGVQTGVR